MERERWTFVIVVVLLLTAAGLGVAAGALFGGQDGRPGRPAAAVGTTTSAAPTTGAPVPGRSATKIPAPLPGGDPVPVYVLGETSLGPRLYREFRPGGGTGDPVAPALAGLAEPPADPDYRTPWLGVAASAARAGAVVTVTLSGAPALRSAGEAAVAVQQVVYTVTAADRTVTRVRVLAPGLPAALTAAAVPRAAPAGVVAPVWLLTPVDGADAGAPLAVSGTASVYEATVSVEVRRGDTVVARATATASVGAPGRGDWSTSVAVPAGDYTVAAFEVSEKDGSAVAVDTKRVRVSGS